MHLRGHTPASLHAALPELPLAVARKLLSRVVARDQDDWAGVPGLSRVLDAELRARARLERLAIVDRRRSHVDPFVKYLLRAGDGSLLEAVRIPLERPRFSVCVSSQVGCALACAFCETG